MGFPAYHKRARRKGVSERARLRATPFRRSLPASPLSRGAAADTPPPMRLPRRRTVVSLACKLAVGWLTFVGSSLALEAHAAPPCDGELSPCFDANNLDLALGPSHFASLDDANETLAPGRLSV